MRMVLSRKSSLFGLGIPPAQYDSRSPPATARWRSVLKARLEKLACDFPLNDNYFAWQAFARRYPAPGEGALPAYLDRTNYETLKANIEPRRRAPRQLHRASGKEACRLPSTATCCSTRRTG